MLKRAGLAVIAIAVALPACAPRPDALPPAPTETFYRLIGKEELADPLFHRSMHAGEQAYNRGDYTTAEKYYSVGLKRAKEIPNWDFFIAWAVSYLFDAYVAQGKYGEAKQLFRESLTIIEKAHPKRVDYLKNYAALLRRRGREAEAAAIETGTKAIPQGNPEGK